MKHRLSRFGYLPVLPLVLIALAWIGTNATRADQVPLAGSAADEPMPNGSWQDFEKPSDEILRDQLDPLQYRVTQNNGTERAFKNNYWDNHEEGIYVDPISGEPLFSSHDKFDSGTGWPSFTRPLAFSGIVEVEDKSNGMRRIEVRSMYADSHLGHLFDDGPAPSGLRYCINSAALRFVPADQLAEQGYGAFAQLFGSDGENSAKKSEKREVATLAGGCFWGMEEIMREIPGVIDTEAGYTGGLTEDATYGDVKGGRSGHAEAVRVVFDPDRISYEEILGYFFRMHDPTTKNRQGNDVGTQYRSAIFVHDDGQRETAEMIKEAVDRSGKWKNRIMTEIVPAGPFYAAESYHQDYLEKNPNGYTCHFLRD